MVDHLVVRDSERYVTIFMSACVVITAAMAVLLRDFWALLDNIYDVFLLLSIFLSLLMCSLIVPLIKNTE